MKDKSLTDPLKPRKIRWVMLSFAFLATVLNYVHRLSFNYLSSVGDLRHMISDEAFGYIGAAFFVAYTISNAFSGFAIDKLGTKVGYALCMFFWNTAGLFHAFAKNPIQFGVVRFFLGIGEAGNWPAALKLTREWFPPRERSTASGIFNTGSAIGAIIVPPLVAYISINYGWKNVFFVIASAGYLWLITFWLIYRTPERSIKRKEKKQGIIPFKVLFRTRFVSMFTLSKFFLDPIWYFVTFWIGRYLVDVHDFNLKQIGLFAMLPFIIADVGNLLGGYFTQFIIQKGIAIPKARRLTLGISIGLMALPLVSAPFIHLSPVTALVMFGLVGFGYTAYSANSLALVPDVVPKNSTASVWGIGSVGTGIGGAIFQALSGVVLMEAASSFNYTIGYNVLFFGYGALAVAGFIITLFMLGPFRKNEYLEQYAAL